MIFEIDHHAILRQSAYSTAEAILDRYFAGQESRTPMDEADLNLLTTLTDKHYSQLTLTDCEIIVILRMKYLTLLPHDTDPERALH